MKQLSWAQIEKGIWILMVCMHLLPIWQSQYFLTGDGPSHVYNAKVMRDMALGQETAFYEQFYQLNPRPEPNLWSHVSLAVMLEFLPDYLAEKLLLTIYVLCFAFGLRYLLRQLHPQAVFLTVLGLPFVFQRTLQMGFYNFSFSIALFFWVLGYWLKYQEQFTPRRMLGLGLLLLLTYFSHPVGLSLAWMVMGLCLLMEGLTWVRSRAGWQHVFRKGLQLTLVSALPLFLLIAFVVRRGTGTTPNPYSFAYLGRKLVELTGLVNLSKTEVNWAIAFSILMGLLLLYGLWVKWRSKKYSWQDAFFLAFLLTLLFYFFQPGSFGGAGIIFFRLQFIPFLMILLWSAQLRMPAWGKRFFVFAAAGIGVGLIMIRLPHHAQASEAVETYLSVRPHLPQKATVVPLSFAHEGRTPLDHPVADRIWLFMHAADYLGSDRHLIMMDNYEGNMGYFPLIWRKDRNPFTWLGTREGIEHRPPSVNLAAYEQKTGQSLDYVITWCMPNEFAEHPYTQDILRQLQRYHEVYRSPCGRVKLFQKRP